MRRTTATNKAAPRPPQPTDARLLEDIATPKCDRTSETIRAYLAAVRPFKGLTIDEEHQRGRAIIDQMVSSSFGRRDPPSRLSAAQCADVVAFIRDVEPIKPGAFDTGFREVPNPAMGLFQILHVVERELRRVRRG